MVTIIVFSKDRPMQLHGYLESMIRASGCREEQICVLYKEVLPIRYDKVKAYFPRVNWVFEEDFDRQLRQLVSTSDEYIMFGCDDVVFIDQFNFDQMERFLDKHEDVFGFSLRLGRNIRPLPTGIKVKGEIFYWNWTKNKGHYGYPWELDCTLYRKREVLGILDKINEIVSPNFFESIPEENCKEVILKKELAAYYKSGKAIVITVNRVQDTHPNAVDDSGAMDVLSLFLQYQYGNRFLDLDRIWKCKNRQIHVGGDFLLLTPAVSENLDENNSGRLRKWRNLFRNLCLLSSGDLEQTIEKKMQEVLRVSSLQSVASPLSNIRVLSPEETVQRLKKWPKSFCRFGDGEFILMFGGNIGFQRYNPRLALALWEIFDEPYNDIYVGIPYQQLQLPFGFNSWIREFYFTSGSWIRDFLYQHLPSGREIYIDTGFNQVYQTYKNMNFSNYYEQIKHLFDNRMITIVVGKGVLDKISVDIFEFAIDIDYIFAPKINAFDVYDDILQKVLEIDKSRLICVILGPCSNVLVRDLTKAGYMAWDIGHLMKDYDAYRNRIGRDREDIANFYAPD